MRTLVIIEWALPEAPVSILNDITAAGAEMIYERICTLKRCTYTLYNYFAGEVCHLESAPKWPRWSWSNPVVVLCGSDRWRMLLVKGFCILHPPPLLSPPLLQPGPLISKCAAALHKHPDAAVAPALLRGRPVHMRDSKAPLVRGTSSSSFFFFLFVFTLIVCCLRRSCGGILPQQPYIIHLTLFPGLDRPTSPQLVPASLSVSQEYCLRSLETWKFLLMRGWEFLHAPPPSLDWTLTALVCLCLFSVVLTISDGCSIIGLLGPDWNLLVTFKDLYTQERK